MEYIDYMREALTVYAFGFVATLSIAVLGFGEVNFEHVRTAVVLASGMALGSITLNARKEYENSSK